MPEHVALPRGTRALRFDALPDGSWRVWTATADFIYGTYYVLESNGGILRVTERVCEGPDEFRIK